MEYKKNKNKEILDLNNILKEKEENNTKIKIELKSQKIIIKYLEETLSKKNIEEKGNSNNKTIELNKKIIKKENNELENKKFY